MRAVTAATGQTRTHPTIEPMIHIAFCPPVSCQRGRRATSTTVHSTRASVMRARAPAMMRRSPETEIMSLLSEAFRRPLPAGQAGHRAGLGARETTAPAKNRRSGRPPPGPIAGMGRSRLPADCAAAPRAPHGRAERSPGVAGAGPGLQTSPACRHRRTVLPVGPVRRTVAGGGPNPGEQYPEAADHQDDEADPRPTGVAGAVVG